MIANEYETSYSYKYHFKQKSPQMNVNHSPTSPYLRRYFVLTFT